MSCSSPVSRFRILTCSSRPVPSPPDLGIEVDVDGWMSRDGVDEVGRHTVAEVRSSYDQVHCRAVPRQVQDRLPGRIARTDHGCGQPRSTRVQP